jgi:hypothetical protein
VVSACLNDLPTCSPLMASCWPGTRSSAINAATLSTAAPSFSPGLLTLHLDALSAPELTTLEAARVTLEATLVPPAGTAATCTVTLLSAFGNVVRRL